MSIAGKDSAMEDIPSRAFKDGKFAEAQKNLASYFNSHFSLPQNHSWKEYRIPEKVELCVLSYLSGD